MEELFNDINDFIGKMKELGIKKIAIAERKEKTVVQPNVDMLELARIARTELLGYKDSVIYKCVLDNQPYHDLYIKLRENGFETLRRTRNIFQE